MTRRQKMVYEFPPQAASLQKLDAQLVGEELARLEKERGRLSAAAVVERGESPSCSYHSFFEWDNDTAANKFRLKQAGYLLGNIRVTLDCREDDARAESVRAFVVESATEEAGDYVNINTALADPVRREVLVGQAVSALESWKRKYRHLKELAKIFKALDSVDA